MKSECMHGELVGDIDDREVGELLIMYEGISVYRGECYDGLEYLVPFVKYN